MKNTGSLPAYVVEFLLQRQTVEPGQRKAEEQTDSPIQQKESVPKSPLHLLGVSTHRGWVWNPPMRGHGLAGPDWANFRGGAIADGEDEIERRSARCGKFVPTLAAQARRWKMSSLQLLQG